MGETDHGIMLFTLHPPEGCSFGVPFEHRFKAIEADGFVIAVATHRDGTFDIGVVGLHGRMDQLRGEIPRCDDTGLHVELLWEPASVTVRMNGQQVADVIRKHHPP